MLTFDNTNRIQELAEKNKAVVSYIVDHLFPYAPVTVKLQKYPDESPNKGQVYLWITVDELLLKKKRVAITTAIKYPVAVAVDNEGNAYVTDPVGVNAQSSSPPRKIRVDDILALASVAEPPAAPSSPILEETHRHYLKVSWTESKLKTSVQDRFEIQYKAFDPKRPHTNLWSTLASNIMTKQAVLDDVKCNSAFIFRVKAHNPAGWSTFSEESTPFWTLPGAPEKPKPPFAGVVANTYVTICWTSTCDNGSVILAYTLQIRASEQENSVFTEVYKGSECGNSCRL